MPYKSSSDVKMMNNHLEKKKYKLTDIEPMKSYNPLIGTPLLSNASSPKLKNITKNKKSKGKNTKKRTKKNKKKIINRKAGGPCCSKPQKDEDLIPLMEDNVEPSDIQSMYNTGRTSVRTASKGKLESLQDSSEELRLNSKAFLDATTELMRMTEGRGKKRTKKRRNKKRKMKGGDTEKISNRLYDLPEDLQELIKEKVEEIKKEEQLKKEKELMIKNRPRRRKARGFTVEEFSE